ncbi:hypothetical protein D3C87_2176980 [compost metagenome]
MSTAERPNKAWIWLVARLTVAVEAMILGFRPSRSMRWPIAVSYRPTTVPRGPEIR